MHLALPIALLLTVLVFPCMSELQTQQQAAREAALLAELRDDLLPALRRSIWSFWACHGVDAQHGGFHATLNRAGEAMAYSQDKGIVQQARHAWAFSTFVQHGYRTAADQLPPNSTTCRSGAAPFSSQQMAETAYEFAVNHLRAPAQPGLFAWKTSRDGSSLVQPQTVLYGQFFVIYGFSQFHAVFGSAEAKQHALNCFRAVSSAWHSSEAGGYIERVSNSIPSDAADAPDKQLPRSLNNLMHGLEALAALHRISDDNQVLAELLQLVDIVCSRLGLINGLLVEECQPAADGEWQPVQGSQISYGHNLEAAWLLADTLDYLLAIDAIPKSTADTYRSRVMAIGAAAVAAGYDDHHGGIYEYGAADGPSSTLKVWWVQCEAMLALWKLYQQGPTSGLAYLEKLAGTARFVRQHLDDAASGPAGEQVWQVAANGGRLPGYDFKGSEWKASYHTTRSVLFLERWMNSGIRGS